MFDPNRPQTPNDTAGVRDNQIELKALIDNALVLGETSTTAYRGDRGKTAYDHSQLITGNPHGVTKADVGLGSVPDVDCTNASNISSGTIDLARLPPSAIERLYFYTGLATLPENFGLTTTQVQNGDTVKVANASNASNGLMWLVINDTALGVSPSFEPYAVGSAAAVPWSGVTSKPVNITDIASTTFANDDFIQKKAGALTNRTIAQVKTDLALTGTNTGDETAARVATINHGTSAKTTLVDADEVTGQDSAASFSLIRTTWADVKAFLKSYFDTFYQPLNAKLSAISALAATSGSAIVGNGTTFVLQALGTAAGKNVGTASTDVAAGDAGMPIGGTTGQALTKIDGTNYNVTWSTVSGGGLSQAVFTKTYSFLSSTVLTPNTPTSAFNNISGLTTSGTRLVLPVGTFIVKSLFSIFIAGKIDSASAAPRMFRNSGGTFSSSQMIDPGYNNGTSAASSTVTSYFMQAEIITISGSSVTVDIGSSSDRLSGSSFTASTGATLYIEILKIA
jgi:hypothetical protein